jgi:hypothetical protein
MAQDLKTKVAKEDHLKEEDSNQMMMEVKDLHRDLEENILIAHLVEIMMAQQLMVIMMAQIVDIKMVNILQQYGSLKALTSQTLQIALTRVGVTQNQTAQNSTML